MVNASEFHPMRGHVEHDRQVRFSSGRVLTIKSALTGWELVDDAGSRVGDKVDSAFSLTELVLSLDKAPS